jgi:hypothetical protein
MPLPWSRRRSPAPPLAGRYRRSPEVSTATHGGRTVLLDFRSEQYFSLDDVGLRVWEALDHDATVDDIVVTLVELYDAPEARIREDVTAFVDTLVRDRLAVPAR